MKGLIKCRKRTIRKQGERKVEKVRRAGHLVFQMNAKGDDTPFVKACSSSDWRQEWFSFVPAISILRAYQWGLFLVLVWASCSSCAPVCKVWAMADSDEEERISDLATAISFLNIP